MKNFFSIFKLNTNNYNNNLSYKFIYSFLIFILFLTLFNIYIFAQQNNSNSNIDNKFNELKKSLEENKAEDTLNTPTTGLPIFRTIIILIILIIIFLILQYFIKKKNINLTSKNEISEIIYKEPLNTKNYFGIIKIFNKYFAAIIGESINIIYELTEKEEIDTAILLKSKNTNLNKSFFELIKNFTANTKESSIDGLKKIKEKLNSIKWGKNE